jgi:AAA+ lid domain
MSYHKLSDGFNGADLRNVVTEAGMFAIRDDRCVTLSCHAGPSQSFFPQGIHPTRRPYESGEEGGRGKEARE